MKSIVPVWLENTTVGKAWLRQQGMLCIIECRCHLPKEGIYRLCIKTSEHEQLLGVFVPNEDHYFARSRIALSKLGGTDYRICVIGDRKSKKSSELILDPQEPFPCLSKLEDAIFLNDGNVPRICFPKEFSHSSVGGR